MAQINETDRDNARGIGDQFGHSRCFGATASEPRERCQQKASYLTTNEFYVGYMTITVGFAGSMRRAIGPVVGLQSRRAQIVPLLSRCRSMRLACVFTVNP